MKRVLWAITVIVVLWTASAGADIYRYVDSKGVIHFSNVPNNPNYRLYMREERVSRPVQDHGRPLMGAARVDKYDPAIKHTARRHGLDHTLVTAVIKVESDFNPVAVSSKGARGLMQLMPNTARELGVRDSFDPLENLDGGVRYLRSLIDFFDGNLPLALAAYNAGREAVLQHGGIPPYPETRQYVSKVLQYYELFRKETGGASPSIHHRAAKDIDRRRSPGL
ncbi:MAG: transglycosylase SLT domain-containing protein [Thermodesulfobacteriota bacterium]